MQNERILFLEDDQFSAGLNCEALRESGYNVVEVHSAAGAYSIIDQHEPLTAMVTDINLGPGKDGFEAARYARAAYPDLSVIYISALNILRFATDRVSDSQFIAKPFDPAALVRALRRAGRLAVPQPPEPELPLPLGVLGGSAAVPA